MAAMHTARSTGYTRPLAAASLRASFEVRVPSEKTARAMEQAREIGRHFNSIDEMLGDTDGDVPKQGKKGNKA